MAIESALRYRFIAPLLAIADQWIDLGCGDGSAADAGLPADSLPSALDVVFVDRDAAALAVASRAPAFGVAHITPVAADLATDAGVDAVHEQCGEGRKVVSCFGVLNQLSDVRPLLGLVQELAAGGATVVIAVADDAAGAADDPERASGWSAGGAEELLRLLPAGTTLLRQLPAAGSVIAVSGDAGAVELGTAAIAAAAPAATHIVVSGPGVDLLQNVGAAAVFDGAAARAQARDRDSRLAYLEARVAQLEG